MKNTNTKTTATIPTMEATATVKATVPAVPTAIIPQWEIVETTVAKAVALLDTLPTVQTVRGSVWDTATATALINDIKEGLYVPPIVITVNGDDRACTDGQQRLKTVATALSDKLLDGSETLLMAIDKGRTVEQSFSVLNKGVPVGASLVSAMANDNTDIITLASHPCLQALDWTTAQVKRTATADFASGLLAICNGWETPESSQKATATWLTANKAQLTEAGTITATTIMEDIATHLPVYQARVKGNPKDKRAKSVLRLLKQKNVWLTVVHAIYNGSDPIHVLRVLETVTKDNSVTIPAVPAVKGKTKAQPARTYYWSTGAGSSGSYTDFHNRQMVMASMVYAMTAKATAEAVPAVEADPVDGLDVATALGL